MARAAVGVAAEPLVNDIVEIVMWFLAAVIFGGLLADHVLRYRRGRRR